VTNVDGIYFDGTLGGGGYTAEILKVLSSKGKVIATDLDDSAIRFCKRKFENEKRLIMIKENFKNIKKILESLKIEKIHGAVLDLGISSYQINSPEGGFSYRFETDFDLRFDKSQGIPAYEILNNSTRNELREIIWNFGEDKFAAKIATALENYQKKKKIKSTRDLVEAIKSITPPNKLYETLSRVFQAFRIVVNDELNNLKTFLENVIDVVDKNGRIAIVSYHSLEDRIVKEFFRYEEKSCICSPPIIKCECGKTSRLRRINKKVITPSEYEIKMNVRARSAKLRIAEVLR